MRNDIVYYIWLGGKYPVPSPVISRLIADFGCAKNIYEASESDFKTLGYLKAAEIKKLADKNCDTAERIIEKALLNNIDIIAIDDKEYPEKLLNIYNPPTVLYVKGNLNAVSDALSIAVVGARNPLDTSISITDSITRELTRMGTTVISGLAYGIDSVAHKAALQAGGKTVALLPCGLDSIYPREHEGLAEFIASSGALVSEYAPGTRVFKGNFVLRNRIISGLSDGVVIVEAAEKSGTLITARHAIEQDRDLFVVPGDVFRYKGSNELLKAGAKPVTQATDILEEYVYTHADKIKPIEKKQNPQRERLINIITANYESSKEKEEPKAVSSTDLVLDANEKAILSAFEGRESLSADKLADKTKLPIGNVIVALTMLCAKGYLKSNDNNTYFIS